MQKRRFLSVFYDASSAAARPTDKAKVKADIGQPYVTASNSSVTAKELRCSYRKIRPFFR